MIRLIRQKATPSEIDEMLETLKTYVKLAVDVEKRIVAGGGAMPADCEEVLLDSR